MKKSHIKMLKIAWLDCVINENVAVLMKDGAFALFFFFPTLRKLHMATIHGH